MTTPNGLRVNNIAPVGERPSDVIRGRVGYGTAGSSSLVGIVWGGEISVTLGASVNDWAPSGGDTTLTWLVTFAGFTVTGIAADTPGSWHVIKAVSGGVIAHESASSSAVNRISCPGGANLTLAAGDAVLIEYVATTSRWQVIAGTGGGTGGGGTGSLAWFFPETYGAIGDDTTDDTTAMQAWLAAINAAGRGVGYLSKRYKVTAAIGSLTVPCWILGNGMSGNDIPGTGAASYIHYVGTTAVVLDLDSRGIKVEGVAFVQTGGTPSSGCVALRAGNSTAADFLQVVGCSSTGFYAGLLDMVNGTGLVLTRSLAHGFAYYGSSIRYVSVPEGGDGQITSCHFDGETYSAQAGLHIESGGGLKVANCKVNASNAHPLVNGIELLVATGVQVTDFLFSNNSIEGWTGNGFLVTTTGSGTAHHINFVGNQVSATITFGHTAIGMVAASAGNISSATVVGNTLRDSGTTVPATTFTDCDDVLVGANTFEGYTVEATFTTCTNVHDRTGGIGAGVQVTGTPSSGDVPIASSGTAAAWGPQSGGLAGGTPALTLSTSNSGGAASTGVRTDATIAAFDTTVPVTQAYGDAAATGSAGVAARRDHKHGMPNASGGIGEILISDTPSTPLIFADLIQNEAQNDLVYADP
jgi:hypothetical protein